ncbi:MAG: hypothetical protein CMJ18_20625 [Phycisphaeraceae bacterium]|nr:hypothetical protein [Phycisphaeraceae bacterium]
MFERELVETLLAPVVMISACGLLCLAQFARLTAITGRIRTFNHERLVIRSRINECSDSAHEKVLRERASGLQLQAERMLIHVSYVQRALFCLIFCIVCMVLSSLSFGAATAWRPASYAAVGLFVVGLLCVLAGMVLVLLELRLACRLVAFETENIGRFAALQTPEAMDSQA